MSYNFNESQASFKYLERGLSEVCLQGMETEHTIVASSSAPTTVTSVAPFHYLISEQAKSIAALQDLQNEVTALLEFRDLVMETFPHLRSKAAEPSVVVARQGKRDWEPGIRVRRKLREQDTSLAPRSRSNSHGNRGSSHSKSDSGPVNSGSSTGSSAVQDSGFCTESKEHCSTSTAGKKTDTDQEAEDELWTLLELIHRKGTKLRLEVEHLQDKLEKKDEVDVLERRAKSLEDLRKGREPPRTKCNGVYQVEIEGLRRERDLLLDRVTEMEAENLANLAQTNQLLAEMGALTAEKRDLEEQLRAAIHSKTELNSRIHDLHTQFISRSDSKSNKNLVTPIAKGGTVIPKSASSQFIGAGSHFTPVKRSLSNEETISSSEDSPASKEFGRLKQREEHPNRIKRTSKELTVLKSTDYSDAEDGFKIDDSYKFSTPKSDKGFLFSGSSNHVLERFSVSDSKCLHVHSKLGTLDGVVSSPSIKIKGAKGVLPDREKTAAILKENNIVELQRHLLTTAYENQVVRHKFKQISASHHDLSIQLDRTKEENEDLRFQLEEKSIELEGTRARVRLLERLQAAKLCGDLTHSHTLPPPSHESPPAPLLSRMALPLPPPQDNSSSTESAHHDSPRKRPPSKIPLKSYTAPKPPSGKTTPKTTAPAKAAKDKKEKNWDPVSRSMKDVGKRESPRPASRESVHMPSNIGRRVRKTSNQDGSFSSTNSTPSMRRDPPSSPAPRKIPSRDRIINSDNESKHPRVPVVMEYPDSLNTEDQELDRSLPSRLWHNSSGDTEYFDSIDDHSSAYQSVTRDREALAECDSLEAELGDLV